MNQQSREVLWLNPLDNVVVALRPIRKGDTFELEGNRITAIEDVATGHKVAIQLIPALTMVVKYGEEIGEAKIDIQPGAHVHVHNVRDITAEVHKKKREEIGI
jgi:altronate hydrolase